MQKQSKKRVIIAAIAATLVLIGFVILVNHNYKNKTSEKYNNGAVEMEQPENHEQDKVTATINAEAQDLAEKRKNSKILNIANDDFVLGDEMAPVTMIEYASLSCPHCAAFVRESFPKLKAEFIDTGKVKFVFRNFPLNQAALVGAMFAQCQADDNKAELPEKYYSAIKALFKTQDVWAFSAEYADKIESIANLDGMSAERFKQCIADQSLQEKILKSRMEAAEDLQLRSAPSFFINGEISEGYVDYLTIKKLIEKKLAEVAK